MTTDNKTLPVFRFARYVNGVRMAEGVTIEKANNLPDAMRTAAKLATIGHGGDVPVLVHEPATLADVQPGGKVRLGDQAERARFEAWAEGASLNIARFNDGGYCDERTVSAWLAWLSAQPSPGKQAAHCPVKHCGMTYARVPADGRCHACGATVQPSPGGQGDALLDRARKLFDELGTIADDDKCVAILADALAARQPVGEPVADAGRSAAYDAIDRFLRNNMDDEAYAAYVEHLEALWATVPAQAVDLGKSRDLAEFALRNAKFHNCSVKREALARELLALIDSHSGVSRD